MADYRFIRPLDVLYLRGNRLFDGAGAHGAALMPPWPSLVAGALRSRMLVDHGINPSDFAAGYRPTGAVGGSLGTPAEPGAFRITEFRIARKTGEKVDACLPLPADLVAQGLDNILYLRPTALHPKLESSYPLPLCPLLPTAQQAKPLGGLLLNSTGVEAYLAGLPLAPSTHCHGQHQLWQLDPRLGIALDGLQHTAAEGQIYTTETVSMAHDCGFLVGVNGADELLPANGLLRFGGDSRGASLEECQFSAPQPDWRRIAAEKRFRLVLTTPGLFEGGWLVPGLVNENSRWLWQAKGLSAVLQSACVPRHDIISGWDVARHRPKTSLKVAPVGTVYYFDELSGDIDHLEHLMTQGMWPLIDKPDPGRRAEGFNNFMIAAWPRHD